MTSPLDPVHILAKLQANLRTPEGRRGFVEALNRALNTWENAPAWLFELCSEADDFMTKATTYLQSLPPPEESNKRLLAAAPDLLAALQALIELQGTADPEELFRMRARAAIAKATGQESGVK